MKNRSMKRFKRLSHEENIGLEDLLRVALTFNVRFFTTSFLFGTAALVNKKCKTVVDAYTTRISLPRPLSCQQHFKKNLSNFKFLSNLKELVIGFYTDPYPGSLEKYILKLSKHCKNIVTITTCRRLNLSFIKFTFGAFPSLKRINADLQVKGNECWLLADSKKIGEFIHNL